jgi:hypothetical protein
MNLYQEIYFFYQKKILNLIFLLSIIFSTLILTNYLNYHYRFYKFFIELNLNNEIKGSQSEHVIDFINKYSINSLVIFFKEINVDVKIIDNSLVELDFINSNIKVSDIKEKIIKENKTKKYYNISIEKKINTYISSNILDELISDNNYFRNRYAEERVAEKEIDKIIAKRFFLNDSVIKTAQKYKLFDLILVEQTYFHTSFKKINFLNFVFSFFLVYFPIFFKKYTKSI